MKARALIFFISLIGCLNTLSCGLDNNAYKSQWELNYMASCKATSNGNDKYCECTLNKIRDKYTVNDLQDIETKITAGKPPEDFLKFVRQAATECLK